MPPRSEIRASSPLAREQVLADVRRIVGEQMAIAADEIEAHHALVADLGCDSLDVIEIVMEIEEHFGLDIPDDRADTVRTVGDMADGVLRLLAEQGEPDGS
jgi:acyl carrier protein